MEVLAGEVDEFPIASILEKIKDSAGNGYEHRIYKREQTRPKGMLAMTAPQSHGHRRGGDVMALDLQGKTKNTYGWKSCHPSGWNGNKKLQNYYDTLTLEEDDHCYAWVIKMMCEISGRPISSIKIIACDMKINPVEMKRLLPGKIINAYTI